MGVGVWRNYTELSFHILNFASGETYAYNVLYIIRAALYGKIPHLRISLNFRAFRCFLCFQFVLCVFRSFSCVFRSFSVRFPVIFQAVFPKLLRRVKIRVSFPWARKISQTTPPPPPLFFFQNHGNTTSQFFIP